MEAFMIERHSQSTHRLAACGLVAASLLLALGATALAQQTTGVAGSPSATTTIPGNQLPPPPQQFRGKIERNAAQSTPYWPARVVPPRGAPNILLIMTDDTGFGVTGTFGGVVPTRPSTASPLTACVTLTSTRRRFARRHA